MSARSPFPGFATSCAVPAPTPRPALREQVARVVRGARARFADAPAPKQVPARLPLPQPFRF